jgi:hypothetical protein
MPKRISRILPIGLAMPVLALSAQQILMVDRAPGSDGGISLGRTKSPGFPGDHFSLGAQGEVWIIDSIRVWGTPAVSGAQPGDVYAKFILFGGIESPPPAPGQPECDCHNLMAIRTSPSGTVLSRAGSGLWQLDFTDLHWSVPGGVQIQFGVMTVARPAPGGVPAWLNQAGRTGTSHQLRLFDEKGRLDGPIDSEGPAADPNLGIHVQVWGHKTAPVVIRSAGSLIEVALLSNSAFDASRADVASLRLGPKAAVPTGSQLTQKDGVTELLIRFQRSETGLNAAAVQACLTGQQDGIPFEGCEQIR